MHNESKEAKAWNQIYSKETKKQSIPVITAWQLNERMYVIFYAWLHLPFPLHLTLKISSRIELPAVLSLSLSLSLSVFLYRYGELQGLNKQETAERYGKEQVHEWRLSFDIPPPNGESLEMCSQRAVAYFREHVSTSSFFLLTFEIHVEFFKSV